MKFIEILEKPWHRYGLAWSRYKEKAGKLVAWYGYIVPVIAEAIKKAGNFASYRTSGPCGIRAEMHIELTRPGKTARVVIAPIDLARRKVGFIDYTANTNEYPVGSMGHLNGLNNPVVDIDHLDPAALLFVSAPPSKKGGKNAVPVSNARDRRGRRPARV